MEVLRRELNLQIEDFGENANLSDKLRSYHNLLVDYILGRRHREVLHMSGRYATLWAV